MPSWTFWKTQKPEELSWNGTKKSLKKGKSVEEGEVTLIRLLGAPSMELEISDFHRAARLPTFVEIVP